MREDLTGRQLGPFRIEGRLGEGAMGTVYRGVHTGNGKSAALKVISAAHADATVVKRFEREIKLLKQFRHANIVRLYGASEVDGIRYYAMELVEGHSLQEIVTNEHKLNFRKAITYGIQICEALQEIHRVGVIHRDLKPANVMVTDDHKVKLMDFGIAKDVTNLHTTELTAADKTVGTVSFMSPEQLSGQKLTRKSDLYSLGILLYRVLTGRLPFLGETVFEYMNQRMQGAYPLPSKVDPDIPHEFDDLIKNLLQQDPADRPRDAYVVMQKLMDIGQKAKEGTLMKTKAPTSAAMMETVEMPKSQNPLGTLLRSVTDRISVRRKKGKGFVADKRETPESFFESSYFLIACLVFVVAIIGYVFWPAGPSSLLADAKSLLEQDNHLDWQKAIETKLDPLLEKYPDSPQAEEAKELRAEYVDKVALSVAEGKFRMDKVKGGPGSGASNAQKLFWDAIQLKKERKFDGARERLNTLVSRYKDDDVERGWVLLARNELKSEIHGEVFKDDDGDGVRGEQERGLPDWVVFLDLNQNDQLDEGELTSTTDRDGYYDFVDLPQGLYPVRVQLQEGWKQTAPDSPHMPKLDNSEAAAGLDFGVVQEG